MTVGIGMRMDPYTICLNNNRVFIFPDIFFGCSEYIHRIKYIFAITVEDLQVFESGEIICHFPSGSLIFLRNRNAIAVILDNKQHRQFLIACTINGFVNITFRYRGFAL